MAPRKEIEHRACLTTWPERGSQSSDLEFLDLSASMLRQEVDRFGREVIDLWWIRQILLASMRHFESVEALKDGACCPECGVTAQHYRGCPTVRPRVEEGKAVESAS